jgi:serine/threonine-protein kinase RsbW
MTDTPSVAPDEAEGATDIAVTPGPLVGPVLRRVVGMLAARADLPLDKLDDAVLVADVVAQRAGPFATEAVTMRLETGERTLFMRVGPLRPGGAEALLGDSSGDVGSVILKVAEEVHVDTDDAGEFLRVCVSYEG